ncbi:unknown [Clostridium sp. CAG:967]|nr:unknown [Clostridium sp. CAG:967]
MEKYSVYLKKFQIAIAIAAAALVGFIFLIAKTVPQIQTITNIQNDYKTQSSTLADTERKLEELKAAAARKEAENENVMKAFFKPIEQGLDTEAVISDEFGEILQIIRENKIKTRSVKYDYDPQDDNFVKNASNRYHVCRVSAEMIGTYANLENFLRELYKHEHFLDISKVEIAPYEKNKRILLASVQFKLYAQKDRSLVDNTPAPAPQDTAASDSAAPQAGGMDPSADGGISPEATQ